LTPPNQNTSNGIEGRSTGNNSNSNYSSNVNNNNIVITTNDRVSTSRTHESFFPKIKTNFESEEELCKNLLPKQEKSVSLGNGVSIGIMNSRLQEKNKTFFHIPDFEIYTIKEILMRYNSSITNFKEKINNWNSRLGKSNRFVKVFGEYINNPEGYISIVLEHMEGHSLTDLIENIGSLNEANLCKIAIQIIQSFNEFNEKFHDNYFAELCSCDLLFDKKGNLKVKIF
jgi:hypothetical protein